MARPTPTGKERFFDEANFIVSKTDLKGVITYANKSFLDTALYTLDELIGKPHSIIRHPDMPRCVFQLLWDTIQEGEEIFAYVVNLCKNGDHYWVLAHVTPDHDPYTGKLIGYHSSRRVPGRAAIKKIQGIYDLLLEEEAKHYSKKEAIQASTTLLLSILNDAGITYEQFLFSLAYDAA